MAEMGLVDIHHSVVETEATNRGYERGLIELAERGVDIIVMDADLAGSSGTSEFRRRFPDRFLDIGLCEQDMIGTAAGLALAGKCIFVTTHGMLAAGKAWDIIRSTICYGALNVNICGADAGLSAGGAGGSRQSLEDVAVMRTLPGMTVIVPADAVEAKKATIAASRIPGPVYIRFAAAQGADRHDRHHAVHRRAGGRLSTGRRRNDPRVRSDGVRGAQGGAAARGRGTRRARRQLPHDQAARPGHREQGGGRDGRARNGGRRVDDRRARRRRGGGARADGPADAAYGSSASRTASASRASTSSSCSTSA